MYYKINGAINSQGCTLLHFILCDVEEPINELHYLLVKTMLEIDPSLPSMKAFHGFDREGDEPSGATTLHSLIFELFGCVLVKASQTKYLAKILSLMIHVDPQCVKVYNKFGLLPLHNAIVSCRHGGSLIRHEPKVFETCFKELLDAFPQACMERDMYGDESGCLPLHLLCIYAPFYGEASLFAANLILDANPGAVCHKSGKCERLPLHYLLKEMMKPAMDGEKVHPETFTAILKACPPSALFGEDVEGRTSFDIMWKSRPGVDHDAGCWAMRETILFHLLKLYPHLTSQLMGL